MGEMKHVFAFLGIVVLAAGCVPERDNQWDPGGINPTKRDSGVDAAIDMPFPDAAADKATSDAETDMSLPDVTVDMPIPDIGIDMASVDATSDVGMDSAIDSTQTVVPDSMPDAPSIDGPKILKLVNGGIVSVGAAAPSATKYRLIESGFELTDRVCGALYCMTGGITP